MAKGIPSERKPPVKRLPRASNPLRPDEPAGTYEVDSHAAVFFPNADRAEAVEKVRSEVNRAAKVALIMEVNVRQRRPRVRDKARRMVKLLDNIDRQIGWLVAGDDDDDDDYHASEIAEGFVPAIGSVPEPGHVYPAEPLVSELIYAIKSISLLRRILLAQFAIRPAGRQRADPLARYFIEAMADAYVNSRGTHPPRGRSGPFVNLIAAAWRDRGFPIPSEPPLEDWLGQKVEVLPDNAI
jgi:hypothetical protein